MKKRKFNFSERKGKFSTQEPSTILSHFINFRSTFIISKYHGVKQVNYEEIYLNSSLIY